jgi:hypothetical protein
VILTCLQQLCELAADLPLEPQCLEANPDVYCTHGEILAIAQEVKHALDEDQAPVPYRTLRELPPA